MTRKLTLSVDEQTISRAKKYADKRKKSLSSLVADYLDFITENDQDYDISPAVKNWSDALNIDSLKFSTQNKKFEYLMDKYFNA